MKADKVVVVDGYSDLPFDLGIPPFLNPEVRYIAGACWDRDDTTRVIYVTHDDLHAGRKASLLEGAELIFVFAGVREASPAVRPSDAKRSPVANIQDLVDYIAYLDCPKILGGPYVMANNGEVSEDLGFDVAVTGDPSKYAHELLSEGGEIGGVDPSLERSNDDLKSFAILGAGLAVQNAGYPSFLGCSVELYRGCPSAAAGGCSFCHETRYTTVDYRPVEDVVAEVAKMAELGCENILFDCPCFLSYFSTPDREGGLDLDPSAVERLLEGSRSVAPELKALHIGNLNPGVLAQRPEEARKILKLIRKHCSDGNFPNLRVITFDDEVALQNNAPANLEQSRLAVEMIAEEGSERGSGGLPTMLPAIEIVYGLAGEREETLEINMTNLREMAGAGKIRGVVARNLVPVPGTPISKRDDLVQLDGLNRHLESLRDKVNLAAERCLTEPGRLIRDVYPYRAVDGSALARKVGVNAVELKVHGISEINVLQDVRITSVGNGELVAVAQPLIPKTVSRDILRLVPEMTEERIDVFMRSRPERAEDFYQLFDQRKTAATAASYFEFKATE